MMVSEFSARRCFLAIFLGSIACQPCIAVSRPSGSALGIRGGVSFELNPNYVNPPSKQSPVRTVTLGDLDRQQPGYWVEPENQQYGAGGFNNQSNQKLSIWQIVSEYTKRLHNISPTLSIGSLSSIAIFVMWQIPAFRGALSQHFVCSRGNLHARPQSLLLSAVSHSSFFHLLMNLMAFTSLGPPLRQTLKATNWPLWPLAVGGGLSGSLVFLTKKQGGCMGLSGVTLSFLALQAKLFPDRQLGMVLAIFPVRVKAQVALALLLVVSAVGSLDQSSRVAHLAHLGGLLYGMAYYEAWSRRHLLRKMSYRVHRMLPRKQRQRHF
jgi:membrane associated rhomboid family serine protease